MKLSEFPALKPILAKTRLIQVYDLLLQEQLPTELIGRVRAINVRDGGILVIGVPTPAVATRARYQQAGWLSGINAGRAQWPGLPAVASAQIRVIAETEPRRRAPKPQRPGAGVGDALSTLARDVGDRDFAKALERLAGICRPRGHRDGDSD